MEERPATTAIWRGYTAVLCLFLMIAAPATLSSCTVVSGGPSGPPSPPDEPVATFQPGQFIAIDHSSITAGSKVVVEFSGANGYYVSVESTDTEDGSVQVPVPAFVDLRSGEYTAGELTVSLQGLSAEARVAVTDLPELAGVGPGEVLRVVLEAAVEEHQAMLANLDLTEAEYGDEVDHTEAKAAVNDAIEYLQNMINEFDATGRFVVEDPDGSLVTLSDEQMVLADRNLASLFEGLAAEIDRRISGQAMRKVGPNLRAGPAPPPGVAAKSGTLDWIKGRLDKVSESTKTGLKFAGALVAAATLTIGVGVLIWGTSITVITTAAVVAVISTVVAFASGLAGNGNTDGFLTNAGDKFNAGWEWVSQIGRYYWGLIPNPLNMIPALKDLITSLRDAKCKEKSTGNQQTIDTEFAVQQFCEETDPEQTSIDDDNDNDNVTDNDNMGDDGCTTNADCATDEVCVDEVCVSSGDAGCTTDADCATDEVCLGGVCVPSSDVCDGVLRGTCWEVTLANAVADVEVISGLPDDVPPGSIPDQVPVADSLGAAGSTIYKFDEHGRLDSLWLRLPEPVPEVGFEIMEYVRFTAPNVSPVPDMLTYSDVHQSVGVNADGTKLSIDFGFTMNLAQEGVSGRVEFSYAIQDATLMGSPASQFESGAYTSEVYSEATAPEIDGPIRIRITGTATAAGTRMPGCPDPTTPEVASQEELRALAEEETD